MNFVQAASLYKALHFLYKILKKLFKSKLIVCKAIKVHFMCQQIYGSIDQTILSILRPATGNKFA